MNPKKVIFHCSATPDYRIGEKNFDLFGAREIDIWHKERGWSGIGYHVVIRRSGIIEFGRPFDKIGAHCEGHNEGSLGVCYIGTKQMTQNQIESLKNVYGMIFKKFGIKLGEWYGHNFFNQHKDCPGFSTKQLHEIIGNIDIS